jgi:hypothetical protein
LVGRDGSSLLLFLVSGKSLSHLEIDGHRKKNSSSLDRGRAIVFVLNFTRYFVSESAPGVASKNQV